MAEIIMPALLAAVFVGVVNFSESIFNNKISSGKEFKLNDSLYKCEKVRQLTELEK